MRHDEIGRRCERGIDRAERIAGKALQAAQRRLVVGQRAGIGAGDGKAEAVAQHHPRDQLPERTARVAMPAPTRSVPPVLLNRPTARGLRTTLRARDAASA